MQLLQAGWSKEEIDWRIRKGRLHPVHAGVWDGHSTRIAFREDRARDRRLAAADYAVNRLTWNQLEDEAEAIAADLRQLLLKKEK